MKKILTILILSLTGCLLFSCSDFLTQDPYNEQKEEAAITDYNNANYAMTGIYGQLQQNTYYGRDMLVIPDASTDNVIISPGNSNRYVSEGQWSITAVNTGYVGNIWRYAYSTINSTNKFLEKVDNIEATDLEKKQLKGEALAIRALCHFDLARVFCQAYAGYENSLGIPYMEKSIIYDKPSRPMLSYTYSKIIADLNDAVTLLTDRSPKEVPYRIDSWAAKAMLARVYMFQQDAAKAKPILKDIIDNGGFNPLANAAYTAAWSGKYNASPKEFMFAISNIATDYPATNALGYMYLQTGYGDLRVPNSVLALYSPTDVRRTAFFKAGTGSASTWTFANKYPSRDNISGLSDCPVMRISDVYLMYAEACAYTGDEPTAVEYLDKIIQRADPTQVASTETGDALKEKIFVERRKELMYEGQYLFDLKRHNKSINSAYRADNTLYTTVPFPSNMRAYPIPQTELDANPNMEQNP